jgi:hypothetical protein
MAELTKERRRPPPRRRVLKGARIVFNNRRSAIDCTVRNLGDHGALLLLSSLSGIPGEFELWIDQDRHPARVVWKGRSQIGVVCNPLTSACHAWHKLLFGEVNFRMTELNVVALLIEHVLINPHRGWMRNIEVCPASPPIP